MEPSRWSTGLLEVNHGGSVVLFFCFHLPSNCHFQTGRVRRKKEWRRRRTGEENHFVPLGRSRNESDVCHVDEYVDPDNSLGRRIGAADSSLFVPRSIYNGAAARPFFYWERGNGRGMPLNVMRSTARPRRINLLRAGRLSVDPFVFLPSDLEPMSADRRRRRGHGAVK